MQPKQHSTLTWIWQELARQLPRSLLMLTFATSSRRNIQNWRSCWDVLFSEAPRFYENQKGARNVHNLQRSTCSWWIVSNCANPCCQSANHFQHESNTVIPDNTCLQDASIPAGFIPQASKSIHMDAITMQIHSIHLLKALRTLLHSHNMWVDYLLTLALMINRSTTPGQRSCLLPRRQNFGLLQQLHLLSLSTV